MKDHVVSNGSQIQRDGSTKTRSGSADSIDLHMTLVFQFSRQQPGARDHHLADGLLRFHATLVPLACYLRQTEVAQQRPRPAIQRMNY